MQEEQKAEKEENKTAEPGTKKKSNKALILILSVVAGGLVIYGVGSNLARVFNQKAAEKTAEKAIEQATGGEAQVDISKSGEKITVETEEGKLTIGEGQLPENFPQNMPIYPGSKITSTSSNDENQVVIFSSEDELEKVSSYYKKELADAGWKIESTSTIANAAIYSFSDQQIKGAVIISQAEKGTQITVEVEAATDNQAGE
jgi:hypothetical protein